MCLSSMPGVGTWTHVQLVGELLNPSFLAFDRSQRRLYTVHGDASEISAFAIDARSGELTFLNQQSTHGKNPVHLTIDPTNRFVVVVANHITTRDHASSLAVLALDEDGSLGAMTDHVPLQGKPGRSTGSSSRSPSRIRCSTTPATASSWCPTRGWISSSPTPSIGQGGSRRSISRPRAPAKGRAAARQH